MASRFAPEAPKGRALRRFFRGGAPPGRTHDCGDAAVQASALDVPSCCARLCSGCDRSAVHAGIRPESSAPDL
eukprot:10832878-Alexandrium_andersonii.AAC.1